MWKRTDAIVCPTRALASDEDAAEEAGVGLDAGDGVLVERAAKACDGFLAAVAPGDELAEERIVVVRNGPAFVNAFIETDAGAARSVARKNFSGRREEIVVRILGVKANLHGVAAGSDGLPGERQTVSGGDGDLKLDEVEAGDLLGDWMLDLEARVDFEEIEIVVRINEEFDGAGVDVTAGAGQAHSGIAHFLAQIGRHDGRRGFLDHFLVAALHGALALAERDDAAVRVSENLNFDVAGFFQVFFEIQARIAEGVHGFGRSVAPSGRKFGIVGHETHPFSATARDGFEQNGIAHVLRERRRVFWILDGIDRAGNGGHVGAACELAAGGF